MISKRILSFLLVFLLSAPMICAQNAQPNKDDKDAKKKKELEAKAYAMLDVLAGDIQSLRLPENRIHTELVMAELFWNKSPDRSRALYRQSAMELSALIASIVSGETVDDQPGADPGSEAFNLRIQIIQAVNPHDPKLALEFLRSIKMPSSLKPNGAASNEEDLQLQIANTLPATDPDAALAMAEEALANGLSPALSQTLVELMQKDSKAAGKLLSDIVRKLSSEDLGSNTDAATLAMNILDIASPDANQGNNDSPSENKENQDIANKASQPSLPDAQIKKLTELIVKAAVQDNNPGASVMSEGEQPWIFNILAWIKQKTALVEKYAPSLVPELRKQLAKYDEISSKSGSNSSFEQASQSNNPEAVANMMTMASAAPKDQHDNLFTMTAMKAMSLGNVEQAIQIIEDNIKDVDSRDQAFQQLTMGLNNDGKVEPAEKIVTEKITNEATRKNLMWMINQRKVADDLQKEKIADAQSVASHLPLDQRVQRLVEIARVAVAKGDKKLAGQLLETAWNLIPGRARNSGQLQAQLGIASTFATIDLAKSTEYMQTAISQLNNVIDAMEVVDGYMSNFFQNDELKMQGAVFQLMLQQCGENLGAIASVDADTAKMLSDQIARPETKMIAQIAMIGRMLGNPPSEIGGPISRNGKGFVVD